MKAIAFILRFQLTLLAVFILLPPSIALSAATAISISEDLLTHFKSDSWQTRSSAFQIIHDALIQNPSPSNKIMVNDVLITLLKREAGFVNNATALEENYTEYYAELIAVVAGLHDLKAADVLLEPSVLTTGNIVIK